MKAYMMVVNKSYYKYSIYNLKLYIQTESIYSLIIYNKYTIKERFRIPSSL